MSARGAPVVWPGRPDVAEQAVRVARTRPGRPGCPDLREQEDRCRRIPYRIEPRPEIDEETEAPAFEETIDALIGSH